MVLVMFPEGWLNWEIYVSDAKYVSGKQNVFDSRQKHFLFSKQQKFVSATMFPSLARPLYLRLTLYGNECVKSRSTKNFSREAKFRGQKNVAKKRMV